MHRGERRVAVVGVDEEPVGQHLEALPHPGDGVDVLLLVVEVEAQLETLSTAATAREAWINYGEITVCADEAAMVAYSDLIAAEHLQVHTADAKAFAKKLRNYGSLFIGELASVVYSDKCSGTNHTLPTMGAGAYTGGLNIRHHAFAEVFGTLAFTAHMLGDGRLYAFTAKRCLPD